MTQQGFILSEDDANILQSLIDRERRAVKAPRSRDYEEEPLGEAPDVYIALTPSTGIPGLSPDPATSGTGTGLVTSYSNSAECTVYRARNWNSPAELEEQVGLTRTVHNLGEEAIPGDTYVLCVREKWGTWVAVSPVSFAESEPGTGTTFTNGYCDLAALRVTDCVRVTTDQGAFTLAYSGGVWTSADEYDYTVGTGPFKLWYDDGEVYMSLDDMKLLRCGDGCWSGGALTGHGSQVEGNTGTGTGTGAYPSTYCAGESFTVCVECACCLDGGWYCVDLGDGCEAAYLTADEACQAATNDSLCSGPYDSEAEALVDCPASTPPAAFTCCGGDLIPGDLTLTMVGGCGTTYTLSYDGGVSKWVYEGALGSGTLRIEFYCLSAGDPGLTYLDVLCDGVSQASNTALTVDCATYTWTFNLPSFISGCCNSTGGIVTVQG